MIVGREASCLLNCNVYILRVVNGILLNCIESTKYSEKLDIEILLK